MSDVAMAGPAKYERIEGDAYFTREEWVTKALPETAALRAPIWECAAGGGHMAAVLARYHHVWTSDIASHGYPLGQVADFLRLDVPWDGSIVTNPPYDQAELFIRHALDLTKLHGGMVAMLLRNEYDSAKSRSGLFAGHHAFAMKIVLRKRPRWIEGPGASPRHNFAWYVWDWRHTGAPTIRWAA